MKLEDILKDLEKQAGFPEDLKKDEDQKEEGKEETKSEKKEDEKKDGGKEEEAKKEEKAQEKSAAFKSGSDLAKEIMEKVASTTIQQINKDDEMNKQASDAGKALAQALLTKLAGVGDENTENGIPEGVVPNKTQVDLAAQVAEHDQSFQPTPGTDGAGNGGTINEIFDAIVADAQARTGAIVDGQTASAPAEGAIAAQAPAQVQVDESVEKMAAAVALVNSGIDFDTAIDLVKQASDELEFEHDQQVKQAAMNELLGQGVDFELAAAMVKQAGAGWNAAKAVVTGSMGGAKVNRVATAKKLAAGVGQSVTSAGQRLVADAKKIPQLGRDLVNPGAAYGEFSRRDVLRAMGGNRAVQVAGGAAGVAALGGGAYALGREKKAAVDMLIENGVDFDTAIDLVNAKADEIYGG